jgi:NAD(P)-dependent dehydrogenase (short-subunit alcohol dehydrogenase family)
MDHLLTDKVVIVTGAGSGIGQAIAYQLGAEGARVVVSDVNESAGNETLSRLRDRRVEAIFVRADVSKPADNEALVAQAVKTFGGLDVAVNNAGIAGASARPLASIRSRAGTR